MKITKIRRPAILLTAAALALALGALGAAAALGDRSPSDRGTPPRASASTSPASTVDRAADARPSPAAPSESPSAQPTLDPNRLADGVYPTYVRAVDVQGATITVDVLQTFFGADAHQAAIEDGVPWRDVRYAPVYIRNENPLLRNLPVGSDVKIKLIGVCTAPNRLVGLTQLSKATTPFTDAFYYDVTVIGGTVERVDQLIAISAC